MALDAGFVAAVLEGFEGTLDEVIERVENSELRASLDALQSRVVALRVSIEPAETRVHRIERTEAAVAVDVWHFDCFPYGPHLCGSTTLNILRRAKNSAYFCGSACRGAPKRQIGGRR